MIDNLTREQTRAAPELLHAQGTRGFPRIVVEGEDGGFRAGVLHNALDSGLLVVDAGDGHAVGRALAGPAGFEVVRFLLIVADTGQGGQGRGDEAAGARRSNAGVEEGVDVGGDDVDHGADGVPVLLDGAQGLGRGDGPAVAGGGELGLDLGDERRELRGGGVAVEDGFVTGDDHLDEVPVAGTPLRQVGDLLVGVAANAGTVNEDAEEHLHAVSLAGGADVLWSRAVGGVEAHRGEALASNGRHVAGDLVGGLARPVVGVRSVGHGPLVAVRRDAASGTRTGARASRGLLQAG